MVYKTAKEHGRKPRWPEIEQAIRRNFGGLDASDPVEIFRKHLRFSRTEMVGVLNNLFVLKLPLLCVHRISQVGSRFTQNLRKVIRLGWAGILGADL